MAWCLPGTSKCEWVDLRHFVHHLNSTQSASYRLARCLDVSDRSAKQPEVLLEGDGDIPAVIERKAVVWPPDALKFHRTEHQIADFVMATLSEPFADGLYELGIASASLRGSGVHLKSLAERLARTALGAHQEIRENGYASGGEPIPWWCRVIPPQERDESMPNRGLGVQIAQSPDLSAYAPDDSLLDEVRSVLAARLKDAVEKFGDYSDHLRIILLEFYGDIDDLPEASIRDLMARLDLPDAIDQVWVALLEWVTDDDTRTVYERLR